MTEQRTLGFDDDLDVKLSGNEFHHWVNITFRLKAEAQQTVDVLTRLSERSIIDAEKLELAERLGEAIAWHELLGKIT